MLKSLINAILVIGSTLAVLILVEATLVTAFPLHLTGDPNWYQYDPELGVRLREGLHGFRTTDHQAEIRTNGLGTVNFQESFADYRTLVFALGDSYTQGTGLPSDVSYPAQLDLKLNLTSGSYEKRYAVVNLGLAAYGLEQEIISLERYRKLLGNPTYILFLGCDNDFEDDQLFLAGYRHKHLVLGNPAYGRWLKLLQWAGEREIGKRLKLMSGLLARRMTLGSTDDKTSTNPAVPVAALERERLNRLLALAKSNDATLIVSWANVEPDGHGGSYDSLKQWARANGVRFADWYPTVASVERAVPYPLWNRHSAGHYRTWVNGIIADAMALEITRK